MTHKGCRGANQILVNLTAFPQNHHYLRRHGQSDESRQHPDLPITPAQIADASLEAAKAGACVAHIHVRDPQTREGL
jgi:hypothetical protein